MSLVFLPGQSRFFLWGERHLTSALNAEAKLGSPCEVDLVTPTKRTRVTGTALPLLDTVAALCAIPAADLPSLPASVAVWSLASKLALDLVCRERVVPVIVREDGQIFARWGAALADVEDAAQVAALALSMPPASHAVPVPGGGTREVWTPEALLRAFLDATADALATGAQKDEDASRKGAPARKRAGNGGRGNGAADFVRWEQRWAAALSSADGKFGRDGFAERNLLDDLDAWSAPALGARDRLRACFRLELPEAEREPFVLRFLLQSPDDPSLLVTAGEVWSTKGRSLARFGRAFRDPQESLLEALGRAARIFPSIASCLAEARPEALALDASCAWQFLGEGARALADAGFGVIVPSELTASGQRRLRLRMRVKGSTAVAGAVSGAAGLGLNELLAFEWEAALGDQTLSSRELAALARHKAPLVRHRGRWIAIDPRELAEIRRRLEEKTGQMSAREAIVAGLAGGARVDGAEIEVRAANAFGNLLARLRPHRHAGRESARRAVVDLRLREPGTARFARIVPARIRHSRRALRQRRGRRAPAPDRESFPPAAAEERSRRHSGPAAEERDERGVHADARAGDALSGGDR